MKNPRWLLLGLVVALAAGEVSAAPAQVKAGRVTIDIRGDANFPEEELRVALGEQIQTLNDQGLAPALADDTAFILTLFYRKQGYSQAEVKWEIASPQKLLLTVQEGPLTRIAEVRFQGAAALPENTLRDYVVGTTRERFPREKKELPYVQADVEGGVDRVRAVYQSEGYLNAVVDPPVISFSEGNTRASILVIVHEGTQYRFGKIGMTGDLVFFPNKELLAQLTPFSSKPYTPQRLTNMERAVAYYYKTHGYYDVKVVVAADPATAEKGEVPVTFNVDSGSVYRFDGVSVEGLDRLSAKFLPNRFASLHGAFYNPMRLDEKFREMMRTGLFSKLHIEPIAHQDTHEIEMHLTVEEAKAKELGFSGGYGTYEGPFLGIHVGERDLLGTGRPISATVEFSQRYLKGEVLYNDPWFLESAFAVRLKLSAISQDFDGYSKFETGFRAEVSRKLTRDIEAAVFLLARDVDITNEGIDLVELGPTSYLVNSLGGSVTWDKRDSIINPGKGFVMNVTGDLAGNVLGSDLEFLRTTARFSYYLPIRKTLLALGARGGVIYPLSGNREEIPIDERFFNGGSRSVRSFAERDLGPKDTHDFPVGGEVFTTFNIEYSFPIFHELMLAVFADAGSVGREVGSGIGDLRYAIGAGFRYRLPVGPLRLDYGYNPSPKQDEEMGAFHFSFGFAF